MIISLSVKEVQVKSAEDAIVFVVPNKELPFEAKETDADSFTTFLQQLSQRAEWSQEKRELIGKGTGRVAAYDNDAISLLYHVERDLKKEVSYDRIMTDCWALLSYCRTMMNEEQW